MVLDNNRVLYFNYALFFHNTKKYIVKDNSIVYNELKKFYF